MLQTVIETRLNLRQPDNIPAISSLNISGGMLTYMYSFYFFFYIYVNGDRWAQFVRALDYVSSNH